MAYRCAILDDYQNVALQVADWSKLKGDVEVKVFNKALGPPNQVIAALKGFNIVCLMRERTLFQRDVISALPDLKLIVTSGQRNAAIDMATAAERSIPVCGTETVGNPTAALTVGLMVVRASPPAAAAPMPAATASTVALVWIDWVASASMRMVPPRAVASESAT